MSVKITNKILSVPPYLSTHWSRVAAIHMKGSLLAITLVDGDTLHIPNLSTETINLIFHHHAIYLDQEQTLISQSTPELIQEKGDEHSIKVAFGSSLEGLGNMMQHDPSQSDSPDLPLEILQKIGAISKIIGSSGEILLPQAEEGCNCFHCQIARTLNGDAAILSDISSNLSIEEPEVNVEDLQFQQWSIIQTGDQLFSVVNRLDEHEKYSVFLGEPVGCTCGQLGCEHIVAVLKS